MTSLPHIHSRQDVQATSAARHVHLVRCRRCNQLFGFEAYRIGRGYSTHNLISIERATEIAIERSHEMANYLAQTSPEIVPCPHCGYIAPDMLDEWGRGTRHAQLLIGVSLAIGGMVFVPLGVSTFYGPHPGPTEWMIGLLLALLVSLTGTTMIAHRAWKIARSRPVEGPLAARLLLDAVYLPALVPVDIPGQPIVRLEPASPVRRSSKGDFYAPLLRAAPPLVCGACLQPLEVGDPAFYRCRFCDQRRSFGRIVIVAACIALLGVTVQAILRLTGVQLLLLCGLSLIIGCIGGAYASVWLLPRSVAIPHDSLRGVVRVPARFKAFVELLAARYSKVDYGVVLDREPYDALVAEADERHRQQPTRGRWKRLRALLTTQLSSD